MSSHALLRFAAATLAVTSLAACPDPAGKFDEFGNRVVDAAEVVHIDAPPLAELPDITGSFYGGLSPGVLPGATFQFISENTLTQNPDGTGSLDVTLSWLHKSMRVPVGNSVTVTGAPVSTGGEFVLMLNDLDIPGDANPISGSDIHATVINLHGRIKTVDLYCGEADGMVTMPIPLDLGSPPSTWAAIRITPGTTGVDLPTVQVMCPAEGVADAGPPDAPPPPDAAPTPDAAPLPDAPP